MDSRAWRIERLPITHPDAALLVEEVQEEYVARYGGRDQTPLDPTYFESPVGAFFVGYLDGRPVASGAWRLRSDVTVGDVSVAAEVKRMYVVPSARRLGLARAVLAHLEETAAAAGARAMVLETGIAQPEAIALYETSGYREIAKFGFYRNYPSSRCFARLLGPIPLNEWDSQASAFDDEPDHGLGDPGTRAAWRDLLLDVLPAGGRVADLGCGTGTLSLLLAEQGYVVTGVDLSAAMVHRARAKAPGVEFKVADAADPPLQPGRFDAVLGRHILWALPDPAAALRRWRELLAPGGRIVLVEGRWHTGAGLSAEETVALLEQAGLSATVRPMPEPVFWGGPIEDERYLVTAA